MIISVIIPSYNSWPLIQKTLNSLNSQTCTAEFEIIVADCSSDGSNTEISNQFPDVILLYRESRDYPGAGRNRAIKHAQGDIIAMIDADAEASPGWIQRIINNFTDQPDMFGFGGAIANARENSKPARVAHFLEFGGYTPMWQRKPVRMSPACNLALKREIFDKVQFLEEWFGNEDVLIAQEIKNMGGRIEFDPGMLVFHHTRDNWDAIFEHQKKLGRDTGRTRFRYKLPGSWLAHNKYAMRLIPLIKYLLLLKRLSGPDRKYAGDFFSSTPKVLKALNLFASGFHEGVMMEKQKGKTC